MDRNSILGFVLIAAILGVYTWYTMPSAEEQARMQFQQDSLAQVEIERQARDAEKAMRNKEAVATPTLQAQSTDSMVVANGDTLDTDSLRQVQQAQRFGIFTPASTGKAEEVVLENERLQVAISTYGARPSVIRLKEYQTHQKTPLYLADPDSGNYEFRFFLGNLDISTKDLHFSAQKRGTTGVALTAATTDPGKYLRITYQLDSTTYFMDVRAELVGLDGEVDARNAVFNWTLTGFSNEKFRTGELQKCGVYYKYFNADRDYLSESSAESKKLEGRTNWVAFKQDFFTVGIISNDGFASNGSEIAVLPLEDSIHTKQYAAHLFFEKGRDARVDLPMRFYLGPNHYGTLRRTEVAEFDRIIDLGWGIFGWMNKWLVIPIFNWLDGWGWNYGIIILVLTIVIKLLLMPLTYKNYISSARMRLLKPEMDVINEKHKDGDVMKKQQATMDLYRKAGVNPASGCLPMLVQLPVLYAMFRFFPASIELRQQSFLWAHDLSTYDSIVNLPFTVPLGYGNHVSLFTILMAASTMIYTAINSKQMPQQQGMPSMKLMMYLFPVMMLFFMNSLPAGLSYYYLLANVISILQMTVMKSWFVNEDKIRAELLQNMKTPRKKSKWQQRLEDMQKQQQAQQNARKRR
ncbi:MAG: membrane protein insertase YidC [Flavobacteriales bacterium]|jgi:YidC/Oxa1 family membrane protein insertase|nr:membrane protein insertase YidC [Flavobacteriales bacterium]